MITVYVDTYPDNCLFGYIITRMLICQKIAMYVDEYPRHCVCVCVCLRPLASSRDIQTGVVNIVIASIILVVLCVNDVAGETVYRTHIYVACNSVLCMIYFTLRFCG